MRQRPAAGCPGGLWAAQRGVRHVPVSGTAPAAVPLLGQPGRCSPGPSQTCSGKAEEQSEEVEGAGGDGCSVAESLTQRPKLQKRQEGWQGGQDTDLR